MAVLIIVGMWLRFLSLSRGALLIDFLVFAALISASRLGFRFLRVVLGPQPDLLTESPKVLLWGAGDLGEQLARRLLDYGEEGLIPIGFVDDDPRKAGRVIHGLRVYGDSAQIPGLLERDVAAFVVITSPRVSDARIRSVVAHVGSARVRRIKLMLEDVALTMAMPIPALETSVDTR